MEIEAKLPANSPRDYINGVLSAIGCFLIIFVSLGMSNTVSIFYPELIRELNATYAQLAPQTTVSTGVGFISSTFITPWMIKRVGEYKTLFIGIILMSLKYFTYATVTHAWQVVVYNSFMGVAFGFTSISMVAIILSNWFYTKKKLIVTIVTGGYGLGSAVWLNVSAWLIQHYGFRTAYVGLGIIELVIGFIGLFLFVKIKPEDRGCKQIGWDKKIVDEERIRKELTTKTAVAPDGVMFKDAIRTPSFWMIAIALLLCGGTLGAYRNFAVAMYQAAGLSRMASAAYLGNAVLIGGIIVMFSGELAQRLDTRLYFGIFNGFFIASMALSYVLCLTGDTSFIMLIVVLLGFCYPFNNGAPQMLALNTFGSKDLGPVNLRFYGMNLFSQAVLVYIVGVIRDATGGFAAANAFLGIINGIALVLLIIGVGSSEYFRAQRKALKSKIVKAA